MRVCIVRQYYLPLDPRPQKEAEALVARGHEVTVVCLRAEGQPAHEEVGGITYRRLPLRRRRSGGTARYLFEYGAFLAMATVVVTGLHLRRRFDVVQVNTMPDVLVFCALVPKLLGARVVLDLHETMPEFFATKFGLPMQHAGPRLVAWLEQASIRFADAAVTCTEPMREAFGGRGAPLAKISVVLNGADEAVFDPAARPRHEHPGEFHIVSHGSIEERYGLDTAIEAVALLRDDLPGLRLRIYGDGSRRASLQALARDLGVADRAWFSDGYVPLDELVQALTDADAGLVAIRRDVFRDLVLCHKMYDFISMRVPAIVSRTRSVEAYFDEACFELFEAGDATDLARAIKAVQEDPARRAEMVRAATAAGERHRWPHQAAVYVASVEGVSGSS